MGSYDAKVSQNVAEIIGGAVFKKDQDEKMRNEDLRRVQETMK